MVRNEDEIRAHLLASNEEFRRLASQHAEFKKQVEKLEGLPHLSEDQKVEEVRLKKLKLRLKDQMMDLVNRYRAQQAG